MTFWLLDQKWFYMHNAYLWLLARLKKKARCHSIIKNLLIKRPLCMLKKCGYARWNNISLNEILPYRYGREEEKSHAAWRNISPRLFGRRRAGILGVEEQSWGRGGADAVWATKSSGLHFLRREYVIVGKRTLCAPRHYWRAQREFRLWEPPYFESFFKIWRRLLFVKKTEQIQVPFFLRKYGGPPKILFFVFDNFWQKCWSLGDQILPSLSH